MVAAVVALSAITSIASAARLSVSGSQWRMTFSGIAVSGGFGSGVTCPPVTLEGSFHSRSIAKVRDSLIGYVTNAASSGSCFGGVISRAEVLRTGLPWHVRYSSFSGALPSITAMTLHIVGFEYQIRESAFGVTCLYRSGAEDLSLTWRREAAGRITSAEINTEALFDCGVRLRLSGTGTVSPQTTLTLI
jgi:hypothetical protein